MISKSCIFYLVNDNPIHLNRLLSSLKCLKKYFLDRFPYTVVFGHEGLNRSTIDNIKSCISTNHVFHLIEFTLPEYSPEILSEIPEKFKGHWDPNAFFSMGYRHMCRYFSGQMFKDSFFDNVEYFLRLDCDSYFTDVINYDLFEFVHKNNILYSSVGERANEMDYVIEGFGDFCKNYFDSSYKDNSINNTFDTHFELINFKWFKTSKYMDYFNSIDETGNIYIRRWGDAPIKYQGVKNLIPEDKVHIFDLPYKHGGDYVI